MAMQDFLNKIPPQALLGLAQGLLSPGPSQGARFGAGLAGMSQGMLYAQAMQERKLKQQQQQERLEALKRYRDPTGAAYETEDVSMSTPDQTMASGLKVPGTQYNFQVPPKYSREGDAFTIAPEAMIAASMKGPGAPVNIMDSTTGRVFGLPETQANALMQVSPGRYSLAGTSSQPTPPEFVRLVDTYNQRLQANPNDPSLGLLKSQIDKKNRENAGMALEIGPDGTIRFAQGGTAAAQALGVVGTAARRDKIVANRDFTSNVVNDLDTMIAKVESDPSLVGSVGSMRRGIQTGVGVATDIAQAIPGIQPIVSGGKKVARQLLADRKISKELARSEFFDPNLSELELFENTIAMALARNRQPDDRLLADVYKSAKEDAKITGLRSSQDVLTKMKAVRGLLNRDITDMDRQLGRAGKKSPTDMSDDELKAFLGIQ